MPHLHAERRQSLNAAVEDTLRWCAPPDAMVIGNHPTDQHWLRVLAQSAPDLDTETARQFLDTLKLAGLSWDRQAVVQIINRVRGARDFLPERDVPTLAEALREANRQGVPCVAAATKLASFVFPAAEVYIWHELAWRLLLHKTHSPGAGVSLLDILGDDESGCGYAAYHAACRAVLQGEKNRKDFAEAARLVTGLLRAIPGPLADAAVPDAFFERYLLAKLLFHEGWSLKFGRAAHAILPDVSSASAGAGSARIRLYERLKSYVRLGNVDGAPA